MRHNQPWVFGGGSYFWWGLECVYKQSWDGVLASASAHSSPPPPLCLDEATKSPGSVIHLLCGFYLLGFSSSALSDSVAMCEPLRELTPYIPKLHTYILRSLEPGRSLTQLPQPFVLKGSGAQEKQRGLPRLPSCASAWELLELLEHVPPQPFSLTELFFLFQVCSEVVMTSLCAPDFCFWTQ